eukprot:TRINITY_DN54227_c0_g1_i1.p1 TRINITY_DN54227_c0_g1~~TRINITY_DN54227_c0_g1_i1.p1  ORF type:complete len:385 (+),score=43.76 TRINITY_DN54227_c0_g1_i1:31-1155(+)
MYPYGSPFGSVYAAPAATYTNANTFTPIVTQQGGAFNPSQQYRSSSNSRSRSRSRSTGKRYHRGTSRPTARETGYPYALPQAASIPARRAIMVLGATGLVGSATARPLLSQFGGQIDIRLGVHHRSKAKFGRQVGAQIAVVEYRQPDSLVTAMQGVDTILAIPPRTDDRVQLIYNVIDAARQAGVRHVILISVTGADSRAVTVLNEFCDMEDYLMQSGLSWTILRCNYFSDNFAAMSEELKHGSLQLPLQRGTIAPVAVADIGDCCAYILARPSNFVNQVLHLTGPQVLDGPGIAAVLGKWMRKDVQFRSLPAAQAYQYFLKKGIPIFQARSLVELFSYWAQNTNNRASQDVQRILNRPPASLLTTLTSYHHRL